MRVCIPLFYESLVYCAFKKYPCLLAPNHKKGLVFWGCHIWSVRFVLSSSRNPCCGCGFGLISISVYDDCTLSAWHSDKKTATHKAKAAGSKFQRTKKHWLEGEGGRTGHREKKWWSHGRACECVMTRVTARDRPLPDGGHWAQLLPLVAPSPEPISPSPLIAFCGHGSLSLRRGSESSLVLCIVIHRPDCWSCFRNYRIVSNTNTHHLYSSAIQATQSLKLLWTQCLQTSQRPNGR